MFDADHRSDQFDIAVPRMPRGKPVILKSISFSKRQDALAFFKAMLAKYEPGVEVSHADSVYLRELLMRHPEASEKAGNGIHHFETMNADYGTKCFGAIRNDGTRVDFSYFTCVNTEPEGRKR